RGTITVRAETDALRRQRLIYHRQPDLFPKDAPKAPAEAGWIEARFEYTVPPGAKNTSVPLEVELHGDSGPLETVADHTVVLKRSAGDTWEVAVTARFKVSDPHGGGDALEVQLPRRPDLGALAAAPCTGFPAALPWPSLWPPRGVTGF